MPQASGFMIPMGMPMMPVGPGIPHASHRGGGGPGSDVNWWFATADDPVGWPYNPHWGSFNPVYGGSTGDPIKSFDFEQGQTGLAIGASLFRTPCAVASWYPDRDLFSGLPVFKYAYIYTPVKFNSGSSLSHVDANIYAGTSDVLMRPAGTLGAGLDALIPSNQRGGVGEAVLGIMRAMGYVTL
eukprot:jgi/Hompol1/6405/HPOL_000948-RA